MDDCVLCRERRGLKISVKTNLSGLGIKEVMSPAEAVGSPIYVPTEIVKSTEGYSVFIRQKISVKQYLAGVPLEVSLLKCILKSLCILNKICLEKNLDMSCILFDYDAVFISDLTETAEFTFLPGLRSGRSENKLKDMLGLILLHADDGLLERMNSKDREFINTLGIIIQDWDESENKIPVTLFEELLGNKKKAQKKNKEKLKKQPVKKERKSPPLPHIEKTYYLDNFPNFRKAEIAVGRDNKWADFAINHCYVSRKHATIRGSDDGLLVRDLNSLNGTYVDEIRIRPGEDISVKEGQSIRFGYRKNFKVLSKKSITMKSK